VWADGGGLPFYSTNNNSFNVRANGGVVFVTGGAGMTLDGQPVLTGSGTGGATFTGMVTAPNYLSDAAGDFVAGIGNTAGGGSATVSGGTINSANGFVATVGGGEGNYATAGYATVGGGYNNLASGQFATVGGGYKNLASGGYATVGGGVGNYATNYSATVPGGFNNVAGGLFSFAAGNSAQATNDGAFVWADSQNANFSSTAANQFLIRAQGGVGINMNSPNGASLYVQGNRTGGIYSAVGYFENQNASGTTSPALRVVADGGNASEGALNVSANGTGLIAEFGNAIGVVADIQTNGTVDALAFNSTSDRNAKENFSPVNAGEVLDKVAALTITRWNFKADAGTRHLGPMAQDFYSSFNVGSDDKHIAVVDEGGVALAAIQGLNQKLEETRAENAELKQRLAVLEKIVLNQESN
jgi:hypothetical protein